MRWASGLAIGLASLREPRADGEGRPRVSVETHLDVPPCAIADQEGVLRVVRVELGSASAPGDATEASTDLAHTTRVTATCDGDVVRVRVDDPITGKSLERSIPIVDIAPAVRARTVGLAIVELIAASWIELELRPPEPEPAALASASPARWERERRAMAAVRRRMPVRPDHPIVIEVSLGERQHQNQLSMGGGELRGSYGQGWLRVGVDGRLENGARSLPFASVEVSLWAVGTHAAAQVQLDRLQLRAGVGVSGGAARLSGRSPSGADELSFVAPVATLRGVFTARARATDRWSVHLSLEGGAVVAGIDGLVASGDAGDGAPQSVHIYRGMFVGVAAGVGVAL